MKAVILAGGKGTRLRPLTDSIPKPLAVLCDRPIICHILDLLVANGFDEAVLTLKYKGEMIENAIKDYGEKIKTSCVYETDYLGTAGSVKNALGKSDEDFLVISGDAYCEFDLRKAVDFHKQKNATVTVITKKVDDPREYGLALSDTERRIKRFIEKPSWSQAVTNEANTGVYVLKGECLDIIPDNTEFDFSRDLFPILLKNEIPVYSYEENGYWCDIGEMDAYIDCNNYVCSKSGLLDSAPRGEFTLEKGVYIGKNVKIYDGALIGRGSFIGDNSIINKNARILGGAIYPDCVVGESGTVEKSVMCNGASTGKCVRINEYCCVGENAVLNEGVTLKNNVNVEPNVEIGDNLTIGKSVRKSVFSSLSSSVSDGFVPDLDCFDSLELGCAVGSAFSNKKILVASDENPKSNAILNAFCSGAALCGAQVWSFGRSFLVQNWFFTSFCSLEAGAFFSTEDDKTVSVKLFAEGGLPLLREKERNITSRLKRRDYTFLDGENIRLPVDMSSMNSIYSRVLFRQSDSSLSKMKIRIECKNDKISSLLDETVKRLEGEDGDDIIIRISADGSNYSVTENNIDYTSGQIMSLLVFYETKRGNDVALPFFSPRIYSSVASVNDRVVMRFLDSSADKSDLPARIAAKNQPWTLDALFACIRLLSLIHEEGKPLSELLREVPDFSVATGKKRIMFSPSELSNAFPEEEISFDGEGVSFSKNGANALVVPEGGGKSVKILTESFSAETASELCADIIRKLEDYSHNQSGADT